MARRTRLYGLFEKQNGKWERIRDGMAYPKATAIHVFQSALLKPFMVGGPERRLRPVGH